MQRIIFMTTEQAVIIFWRSSVVQVLQGMPSFLQNNVHKWIHCTDQFYLWKPCKNSSPFNCPCHAQPKQVGTRKIFCSFYPIFVVLSTIFNYVYCKLDMLVYVVYRILWCMFFVKCCKYDAEFISRADIFCADKNMITC